VCILADCRYMSIEC